MPSRGSGVSGHRSPQHSPASVESREVRGAPEHHAVHWSSDRGCSRGGPSCPWGSGRVLNVGLVCQHYQNRYRTFFVYSLRDFLISHLIFLDVIFPK